VVTNWTALAAADVHFVYLKATEGATYTDPAFSNYWRQAKTAGVRRGAYHFFRPLTSPEDQADQFCNVIGNLEPGDLPPALDLEETVPAPDQWPSVPAEQRVALVLRFLERLTNHCGIQPIIYTRRGWIASYLPNPTALAGYRIWLADYRGQDTPAIPAPWQRWTFWQHSDSGTVPGVQRWVDLNRFFGSAEDLTTLSKT
jgi:lysozyme